MLDAGQPTTVSHNGRHTDRPGARVLIVDVRVQAKTTQSITFDPPSEGQNSVVAETAHRGNGGKVF